MGIKLVIFIIFGGAAIAGTSFFASSLLLPAVKKMGIIDSARRAPLWGGLVFMTIIAILALLFLSGVNNQIVDLLLGIMAITVFGLLDDVLGLSPIPQLLFQGALAFLVVWGVVGISATPFVLLLILMLIASINSVNWIDGIDGLAASFGITVFSIAGIIVIFQNLHNLGVFLVYSASAIVGFLIINRPPARMYMGTAGSMGLGFVIASIPLINASLLPIFVGLLALPLGDAIWVITQRLYAGCSPLQGDRRHLHYRLLNAGWKESRIIALYVLVTVIFGAYNIVTGFSYIGAAESVGAGTAFAIFMYFTTDKGYITLYKSFFGKERA